MNILDACVLGYLNHHCRGAVAARKIWKIAEDLTALGLPGATERAVRDALSSLRLEGLPIGTTCGDPPGAFLRLAAAPLLASLEVQP